MVRVCNLDEMTYIDDHEVEIMKGSEFKTEEGIKHDSGKLRFDLIPPEIEEALAIILTHGADKYGDRNWESGIRYSRIYGAIRRHLNRFVKGQRIDEDSGLPTLYHAFCELAFLITYETRGLADKFDDLTRENR